MTENFNCDVVVIGSGTGGYSAAFRAADLGKNVIIIEIQNNICVVCLNVGCIPSKTLLHAAKVITEAKELQQHGIDFGNPKIDINKLRKLKNQVVSQLTGGLNALAKKRKVKILKGEAKFQDAYSLNINDKYIVNFKHAIIAAGSTPTKLPFIPHNDKRILDSTSALELSKTDGKMLILGGGVIGLEMATVYQALGCEIHVVEFMDQLIPGADTDIMKIFYKQVKKHFTNIMLETKVIAVEAKEDGLHVKFSGKNAPSEIQVFDQILVAVGRRPNGKLLDAEKAGIKVSDAGFIEVSSSMRTNVKHIFAIGDIIGQPMLAHKASTEAHVAAEVIAGKKHEYKPMCIPSVAYTDPEIAWTGMTENEAKKSGINFQKSIFPWLASGRALSSQRSEGITKLLINKCTGRIIGGAIIGINAGELISEISLAIEMCCDVEDVALTIHPHPTLSETIKLAAEVYLGTITDF